jgi:phosphate transport system protein
MLRANLEREMGHIEQDVLAMGEMVAQALLASVEALKDRDFERSKQIIEDDREINSRRFEIEADILTLIATQQPVAIDLRTLAAMLEIITELERIGDYAKGVSKINLMIGDTPLIKPLIDIPIMAEKACDSLRRALQAFVRRDVATARAIPADDDEVDALYDQVARELLTYIISDPRNIEQANLLVWAAHNLERAADRVTNICERVVFTVTGVMSELDN